ncbi:MAG: hypothetical protein H8E46_11870 [FCB group bacterium]|nr:hypothetical protein [FCB group bacterium]
MVNIRLLLIFVALLFVSVTACAQDGISSTFDFRFTELDTPIVIPDSGGYFRVGLRIVPLYISGDNYISLVSAAIEQKGIATLPKICVIQELSLVPNEPIDIFFIQYVAATAGSSSYRYECALKSSALDSANEISFDFLKTGRTIPDSSLWSKQGIWPYRIVEEKEALVPEVDFFAYQYYPSPFAPNSNISFRCLRRHRIKQSIYNHDYEILSVKDLGFRNQGKHTTNLSSDFESLGSGIYLVKFSTDTGMNACQRMIIMK